MPPGSCKTRGMRTPRLVIGTAIAGAALLAACGDNGGNTPAVDARPTDGAVVDTADVDAASIDAAAIDAAQVDAAQVDAAQVDAASIDAVAIDAPSIDAAAIDAAQVDAPDIDAPLPIDAGTIDALPALAPHLLITEVKTVDADEFVEIYNPTDHTVDLRNYYLTDHQSYFLLPGVVAGNTTVTTDASDFLVRFPVGAMIAPRQVITVAPDAVGFTTSFGAAPTYSIQEQGGAIATELLWQGTTAPNPGLTNAGEMVALFYWDGTSDNVKDVDIVLAGNAPTAANSIIPKTAVDGPDADTTTTAYATDTVATPFDMETDTPTGRSYKRIAFEGTNESHAGTGNGITGDDETSELVRTTWDSQAVNTNYTAGTPGTVPAALQ